MTYLITKVSHFFRLQEIKKYTSIKHYHKKIQIKKDMAKKSMIQRDKKRHILTEKYSKQKKKLKKKVKLTQNFDEQLEIQKMLQKFPRNSLEIRQRKRCAVTGRSRGYFRQFGISRHVLREMAHNCLVPGLTKSSW